MSLSIYQAIGDKEGEQNVNFHIKNLLIQKKSREKVESEDGIGLGSLIGLKVNGEDVFGTIVEFDDEKSTIIIKKNDSRELISGSQEDMFME